MWASRLTSTGARKYVSLLFMNLMASDGIETSLVPQAAFKPMRVKRINKILNNILCTGVPQGARLGVHLPRSPPP